MIIAHHLIWTAYGWWLPNDPRGSSSTEIVVERIAELGPHHYGRKTVQPPSQEIRDFYTRAQFALVHDLLEFNEEDVTALACSFAQTIKTHRYTCYACAIMPDHIHLVIRKHRDHAEMMIEKFQEESRVEMIRAKRRAVDHPVWGGPGWKVFLDTIEAVERAIEYVRQNPVKIRRPIQEWDFVTPYDRWLPGGHPDRAQ
jgi:REP element-mobilizing transposase RayT